MKFRLRQLVLGAASVFVVACASESAAKLEQVEPAPRLAVRPLLLLHASDDLGQRGELESAFGLPPRGGDGRGTGAARDL